MNTSFLSFKSKEDQPITLLIGLPLGSLLGILAAVLSMFFRLPFFFPPPLVYLGPVLAIFLLRKYLLKKERQNQLEEKKEEPQAERVSCFAAKAGPASSKFAPLDMELGLPAYLLSIFAASINLFLSVFLYSLINLQVSDQGYSLMENIAYLLENFWLDESLRNILLFMYLGLTIIIVGTFTFSAYAHFRYRQFKK